MGRIQGIQAVLVGLALIALLMLPWGQADRTQRVDGDLETVRWDVHAWWTQTSDQAGHTTSLSGPDDTIPLRNVLGAAGFSLAVVLAAAATMPGAHRALRRSRRGVRVALVATAFVAVVVAAADETWTPFAGLRESCGAPLTADADGTLVHRCTKQELPTRWFVAAPAMASVALLALVARSTKRSESAPGMPTLPESRDQDPSN